MKGDFRLQMKLSRKYLARLRAFRRDASETCERHVSMNELLCAIVEEFLDSLERNAIDERGRKGTEDICV